MIELTGKYNTCKVFTDIVENEVISQLITLLNQSFVKNSKIRIMPDVHAGAGCVIGTTMTLYDKAVPNLVGVDIGCGMLTVKLKEKESDIDMMQLDKAIRKYVPSGFNVHPSQKYKTPLDCKKLACWKQKNANINDLLAYCSIGTLGGGNHFIEVDKDFNDNLYLVIHTGSRHLGLEIAHYYQNLAWERFTDIRNNYDFQSKKQGLINKLQSENRHSEINAAIRQLYAEYRKDVPVTTKELAYVEGHDFDHYIHDMKMVQEHASANRAAIAAAIITAMDFTEIDRFETIHNYIDTEHMILRKGSVSAQKGEQLLIPMNMRDGSLICIGKGNPDWNYSAPHGAGRLMSRRKAKENISMEDFEQSMDGIFTTSVNRSTIDESPFAYKPMESIIQNVEETVDITDIIKPIYNFKAGD